MAEIHNCKTPRESVVELAIAALDGNPNPLDQDMSAVNPDRTSLDLPEEEYRDVCSRSSRPAVMRTRNAAPRCAMIAVP